MEGALLAMDVRTGAVRAMVGGYDFERSKFNRATQAMRQVGSAFKPIVYAAAIETLGWTPATIHRRRPAQLPEPLEQDDLDAAQLRRAFMGPIPLRRAVEQSRNIPAVKTLQAVGIETGIEYARKLGLAGELPPFLPIALGAGEATLTEMIAAYATFANQGLRMKPFLIERHHGPRRQRRRAGDPPGDRRPAGRHRLHPDLAAPGGGRAGHRGPGAPAQAPDRREDRHHERLHRRLVHRLRALARGRASGSASTRRRSRSAAGRRAPTRRCRSGWTSGPRSPPTGRSRSTRSRATSSSSRWTRWAGRASPGPGRPHGGVRGRDRAPRQSRRPRSRSGREPQPAFPGAFGGRSRRIGRVRPALARGQGSPRPDGPPPGGLPPPGAPRSRPVVGRAGVARAEGHAPGLSRRRASGGRSRTRP